MGPTQGEGPHLHRPAHGRDGETVPLLRHLDRFDLKPDKKLGQHWLTSDKAVRQIIDAADGLAGVLEVGPGPGILTRALAPGRMVVAIDLDPRMVEAAAAFAPGADVRLLDALQADWMGILDGLPHPRGIVSNMPYNITGPLLAKVAECQPVFDRAVLMMQREVGEKLMAPAGDRRRGAVSVVFQRLFTVSRVCLVPPGAFLPPPKVESIVLRFVPRLPSHEGVFALVRQGFSHPRKTLANNLAAWGKDLVAGAAEGLSPTVRPHELAEEDWFGLYERLNR